MNENGFQFRTAAFGGFQKQDVMDYLERSAREHAQKLAGLQKELAEEKVAEAEAEERMTALEERIATLEAENKRLTAAVSDRDELQALTASLQAEIDRLTPAAAAYETVKDRTASIELEAHGRAQAIEQEGRARVQRYQEQVKEWFLKTRESYDRLRAEVTAAISRAAQDLEKVADGLEDQESAFASIQAQIEALDSAKPPQPLTLEELEKK